MENTFKEYSKNLKYDNRFIYSYETKVAEIIGKDLVKLEWEVDGKTSSQTTNKHINYAANELNLNLV